MIVCLVTVSEKRRELGRVALFEKLFLLLDQDVLDPLVDLVELVVLRNHHQGTRFETVVACLALFVRISVNLVMQRAQLRFEIDAQRCAHLHDRLVQIVDCKLNLNETCIVRVYLLCQSLH